MKIEGQPEGDPPVRHTLRLSISMRMSGHWPGRAYWTDDVLTRFLDKKGEQRQGLAQTRPRCPACERLDPMIGE